MAGKHKCPVCGEYEFDEHNSLDICDICSWCDDAVQENSPDYKGGANKMSLNEAIEAYEEGKQIK